MYPRSCTVRIKKRKTGHRQRTSPRSETMPEALGSRSSKKLPPSTAFKNRSVVFSPKRMGIVSLPTIRSPCISRISKKAVLASTIPADHRNTIMEANPQHPEDDKEGKSAVTTPHATEMRMVLEPGISLIFLYFNLGEYPGTSFRLYESPIKLMARIIKKGICPIIKAVISPAPPDDKARTDKKSLCFL